MFRVGVGPVGQKGEIQLAIGVRQKVYLKPVNQLLDVVARGEKRRNDNQRTKLLWHAFAQRQARNDSRIHQACHHEIDNCHAGFRGWQKRKQCQKNQQNWGYIRLKQREDASKQVPQPSAPRCPRDNPINRKTGLPSSRGAKAEA